MKKLSIVIFVTIFLSASVLLSSVRAASITDKSFFYTQAEKEIATKEDELAEETIPVEKKLGTDEFLRDTALYYTSIWLFRLFYVRNKDDRIFDTSISDWLDNIFSVPVWDDGDDFVTNYIAHPFAGYMSYLYYREMEHGFWVSALGSVVQSTLFEYTVEGTVEVPSGIDLIATPGIGVPVGYVGEHVSDWLMERDNFLANAAGRLINPMQNVVKDRQLVLFNPVKGQFEYTGTFSLSDPPAKKKSIDVGYPMFFESAIPQGYFAGSIEVADLEEEYGGAFIVYYVKAEFPSKNNLYSVYLKIPQAGIEDINEDEIDTREGFELANASIGGKYMVYKSKSLVFTLGMENILPTAYKDNINRLRTLQLFRRDFPTFLRKSYTITPYISSVYFKDRISVHANLGMDNVLSAKKLEGDSYEGRLRYGAAVGYNVPIHFSPVIFAEFDGYTTFTADTFDKEDILLTTGLRFGGKYGAGLALQVPLAGATSDVVSASVIADLKIRF